MMGIFHRKVTSVHKANIPTIKAISFPSLKLIGPDSVREKKPRSLKEWVMAGGGMPTRYAGREHVWHKKVAHLAAGGEVYNTEPDVSDGEEIIPGPAFARGGAVNMAKGGDSIKPTPRRKVLGAAADAVNFLHEAVAKPFGYDNPPGEMLSSLLGVPAVGRTLDRMSYGEPLTNYGKANKPLLLDDTADAAMAVAPFAPAAARLASKGAKAAGRGALDLARSEAAYNLAQRAMASPALAAARPMGVVKEPGGNWLGGAGSPESALAEMKARTIAGETPAQRISKHEKLLKDPSLNQDQLDRVAYQLGETKKEAALDNWVDKNLTNYVKKQMGTVDDPVRKLAEEGISHLPERTPGSRYPERVWRHREAAGFPKSYGTSHKARVWEELADERIGSSRAGELAKPLTESERSRGFKSVVDYNPWLTKLDPEAKIHHLSDTSRALKQDLGFDHIFDVLKEDVAAGRIRPEQLSKVSMEQAVRRTHEYDQEMAKKMREAQIKATEGMPVHKEYPEGYKWIELKAPKAKQVMTPEQAEEIYGSMYAEGKPASEAEDWMQQYRISRDAAEKNSEGRKVLEDALKYEGDTMGHCVGGYCPDVMVGKSRIYSLRDAKGEPHVTVEVQPADRDRGFVGSQRPTGDDYYKSQNQYVAGINDNTISPDLTHAEWWRAKHNIPESPLEAPVIRQIKGKQNREPHEQYLPYVQDFVRSGKWSDVGDIKNTGLRQSRDVFNPAELETLKTRGRKVGEYLSPSEIEELQQSFGSGMAPGGEPRMAGGGLLKAGVKAGVKKLMAEDAPKGVKEIIVRTPEERAVMDKWGQKQEQEAARKKKVEKANKAASESAGKSPEESVKPAKAKGPRVKSEADTYRKMAADLGDEAVLKAARSGEQLKPTSSGYVGAPRTVTSPQGLGAMRKGMDADFSDAVDAVRLADPERLGTWYDRAKQGIAESVEPYQLPRTLEQHGVYSAGVSPESELTFALKHLNSRVAGLPEMAYRGAGMRNLDSAVAENRPAKMGFKIGEYAEKNDPRVPNAGLFGVNDFRRAQGMGYTDPQGNPWKAGVSETMHPFMDAETALQVDRANAAGTGGRSDWAGPHIQEVPWVYGKGQDLHGRGLRGRYAGDELEGIKSAIQDANNTARDYMYKHAASATHEAIPGASLGHVRQALDMTPEEKLAYGRQGRWDTPSPEMALNEYPQVGAGNRDAIYSALGYRQLPSREASGLYMNKLGGVETNPMTIARPLMDFPTGGGGGRMADESSRMMDTAEQFRALMDAQEAGAYNLPNTMAGVKGKNSMVFDTRGRYPDQLGDPTAGVLPTSEQLAKMGDVMGEHGFGVTATNRGAVAFPFDSGMNPKEASSAFRKTGKAMQEIFPSSQEKAITSTGYVPGVGKRSAEGPLSTAPYSGEATSDMLRAFAERHPSVAQNLSESELVRADIREKALRDAKMGGARGDIQETRRFFSEADWPRAVEMIRKGMTPAAALAALGYSASSMAGEEP